MGFSAPSQKNLPKEVESNKIKVEMVRRRKKVGEKTILGDNFVERKSEKEEVLAYHIVTTS